MKRSLGVASLFAALMMTTPFAMVTPLLGSGFYNPSAPTSPQGMNVGLQMIAEQSVMRRMLGGGRAHGYVKNRGPGERAHRRWRQRRSSGIAA